MQPAIAQTDAPVAAPQIQEAFSLLLQQADEQAIPLNQKSGTPCCATLGLKPEDIAQAVLHPQSPKTGSAPESDTTVTTTAKLPQSDGSAADVTVTHPVNHKTMAHADGVAEQSAPEHLQANSSVPHGIVPSSADTMPTSQNHGIPQQLHGTDTAVPFPLVMRNRPVSVPHTEMSAIISQTTPEQVFFTIPADVHPSESCMAATTIQADEEHSAISHRNIDSTNQPNSSVTQTISVQSVAIPVAHYVAVEQPVVEATVKQTSADMPVAHATVEQPIAQTVVKQAVTDTPVAQATLKQPIVQPVVKQTVKDSPVAQFTVKQPIVQAVEKQTVADTPAIQTTIEQPVVQSAVEQPVVQPTVKQAVADTPVAQATVEQPISQSAVKQTLADTPAVQVAVEQPVVKTAVKQTVADTPAVQVAVEQPVVRTAVKQPVADTPAGHLTVEQPIAQTAVKQTVADTPVAQTTIEQPIVQTAIKLPVVDTPVVHTAIKQPIAQPAVKQTVADTPVAQATVEQPISQSAVKQTLADTPAVQVAVEQPVVKTAVKQTVKDSPVGQVAIEQTVAQPVVKQPVADTPVAQAIVEQPIAQPVVKQTVADIPVAQATVEQPIAQPAVKQTVADTPVAQTTIEQPVIRTAVKQPVADTPVGHLTIEQPIVQPVVKQTVADIPVAQSTVEQPIAQPAVKQTVADTPVGHFTVEQPVVQPAVKQQPVVDIPAAQVAFKQPVMQSSQPHVARTLEHHVAEAAVTMPADTPAPITSFSVQTIGTQGLTASAPQYGPAITLSVPTPAQAIVLPQQPATAFTGVGQPLRQPIAAQPQQRIAVSQPPTAAASPYFNPDVLTPQSADMEEQSAIAPRHIHTHREQTAASLQQQDTMPASWRATSSSTSQLPGNAVMESTLSAVTRHAVVPQPEATASQTAATSVAHANVAAKQQHGDSNRLQPESKHLTSSQSAEEENFTPSPAVAATTSPHISGLEQPLPAAPAISAEQIQKIALTPNQIISTTLDELTQALLVNTDDSGHINEIRLLLKPDVLDGITIILKSHTTHITVSFFTTTDYTTQLLCENQNRILETLAACGNLPVQSSVITADGRRYVRKTLA